MNELESLALGSYCPPNQSTLYSNGIGLGKIWGLVVYCDLRPCFRDKVNNLSAAPLSLMLLAIIYDLGLHGT